MYTYCPCVYINQLSTASAASAQVSHHGMIQCYIREQSIPSYKHLTWHLTRHTCHVMWHVSRHDKVPYHRDSKTCHVVSHVHVMPCHNMIRCDRESIHSNNTLQQHSATTLCNNTLQQMSRQECITLHHVSRHHMVRYDKDITQCNTMQHMCHVMICWCSIAASAQTGDLGFGIVLQYIPECVAVHIRSCHDMFFRMQIDSKT